jgi:hypothetical protein
MAIMAAELMVSAYPSCANAAPESIFVPILAAFLSRSLSGVDIKKIPGISGICERDGDFVIGAPP